MSDANRQSATARGRAAAQSTTVVLRVHLAVLELN